MKRILIIFSLLFFPHYVSAFELSSPVDCKMNVVCYIQNYVDVDPTKEATDYKCNKHTYDGHKGIDFRLADYARMEKGIKVFAAAGGIVKAVRDGMEDKNYRTLNPKEIENRECGNGVLIDHGDGWETQYCHLKKGSVTVRKGINVEVGEKLGLVGLSGQSEFPHVHFEVRKNGKVFDPFTNREMGKMPCSPIQQIRGLWSPEATQEFEYKPTNIISIGVATEQPNLEDINNGKYRETEFSNEIPLIVFWVNMIGIESGQTVKMEIFSPVGEVIVNHEKTFDKPKAQQFYYLGKRSPTKSWEPGDYLANIKVIRKNQNTSDDVITEKTLKFKIKSPGN